MTPGEGPEHPQGWAVLGETQDGGRAGYLCVCKWLSCV